MGDHQRSIDVSAPASELFDFLADVGNLPRYFERMVSAEPAGGEAVKVVARVNDHEVAGEAWFRADHDAQRLEWGSKGPNDYHGTLEVTGDADTSRIEITLHTLREGDDPGAIDEGIEATLDHVRRLVEAGPAPSSE